MKLATRFFFLSAMAFACSCQSNDSVISVVVTTSVNLGTVSQLRAIVSNAGLADVKLFPQKQDAGSIEFPTSFALIVPAARNGVVDVIVEALGESRNVVGTGAERASLKVGARVDIAISLSAGISACGNASIDIGETCDDGNRLSGDGCDFQCRKEELVDAGVFDAGRDGGVRDGALQIDAKASDAKASDAKETGGPITSPPLCTCGLSTGCTDHACFDLRRAQWPMPHPRSSGLPNPASYTTPAPGVVLDEITGLAWQQTVETATYTWADAGTYCDNLVLGGFADWRLPSRIELVSLVDFTRNPAIDPIFSVPPAGFYWTASHVAAETASAWVVFLDLGFTGPYSQSASVGRARCVRIDHQVSATPSTRSPANGVVRDTATRLAWQQSADAGTYVWASANPHCAGLVLGTGTWRTPSMKEAQTIVDETASSPAIDPSDFPGTPSERFWTSTPAISATGTAWYVDFANGVSPGYGSAGNTVDTPYRVRCVQ